MTGREWADVVVVVQGPSVDGLLVWPQWTTPNESSCLSAASPVKARAVAPLGSSWLSGERRLVADPLPLPFPLDVEPIGAVGREWRHCGVAFGHHPLARRLPGMGLRHKLNVQSNFGG